MRRETLEASLSLMCLLTGAFPCPHIIRGSSTELILQKQRGFSWEEAKPPGALKAWQQLSIPGCILGKLEEIRDQERKEDTFTPMPSPYYMELTKLLLN